MHHRIATSISHEFANLRAKDKVADTRDSRSLTNNAQTSVSNTLIAGQLQNPCLVNRLSLSSSEHWSYYSEIHGDKVLVWYSLSMTGELAPSLS